MYKSRIIFFSIPLLLAITYAGGCRRAGKWLVKEDVPQHADAMVLLMGSFPDRVLQAVDLWQEGRTDRVIIVEESMGPFKRLEERGVSIISNSEQAANSLVALGIPADSITVLPGDARSTLDEAMVVRGYLADSYTADTILLVSSASHMRRACMIFNKAFKESGMPVYVGCSPSAWSSFNPEKWWRRKEDVQSVMSELVKIGSFVVFEKKKYRAD